MIDRFSTDDYLILDFIVPQIFPNSLKENVFNILLVK